MNIRSLIKEVITRVIHEEDVLGGDISGTIQNISTQLSNDLKNVESIIDTQKIDFTNDTNKVKSKLQLKSRLNQNTPERKGLEREVPESQKELKVKEKQLKDLETTKNNIVQAKSEIEKQSQELEKQSMVSKMGKKASTPSVLPSLNSPI
jgi:septal ring factor EnvC (AmiA/AmiB activator)